MANGQFKAAVLEATRTIEREGWENADIKAVLLFGFGHLDSKMESRVVRLNGKLAASALLAVGGLVGGILRGVLGV
ncbi:hypothetical protein CMI37_34850 [Candidatus Pacearchaeota archaeon]|nr:hypothetical protein [Candidatus Pacearchaeota archaeon]|tara:strand:- start:681 stop:908 length:228 start_codon:yes stop_codon:yes gene_type:complete